METASRVKVLVPGHLGLVQTPSTGFDCLLSIFNQTVNRPPAKVAALLT